MILRVCVVIPCYNHPRTISEVVNDVITSTPFPVLLIDDGSESPVAGFLYSWDVRRALEEGRVTVVRFEQNRGKGAALQYAIGELARQGYTHMLTMDADGQHHAREITKLTELAKKHPWDLIIGDRKLKSETVPELSKFGRKFSNFWVKYETGMQIKDSQSGFRLYPLLPVQTMRFFTKRYDFEIEILIRLLWRGVQVRESEIDVHYQAGAARITHFNKFWDNLRISLLNTLLVSVSLLRSHRQPRELASAVALGVFVGCTPFFGFHTLIVAGLALTLRLNLVVMWLGTHVSTPILAPFVIMGEIWIGRHWLHIEGSAGHSARENFMQWMGGSLVLGVGLSLLAFAAIYLLAWRVQTGKRAGNWTGRSRGGRLGNGFLRQVIHYFGLEAGYLCLAAIVPYFYIFAPTGRRGIGEYWKLRAPEESWGRRQRRVLEHFYRFGQVLMDRARQSFFSEKKFTTASHGMENIKQSMQTGRGLIILTAHAGAWDLAASLLGNNGFTERINVVEYRPQAPAAAAAHDALNFVDSGKKGDAIFEIHSALKAGGCLALMGDRPLADRFELVPMLGKLAPFDMTPFRLAAATQVPMLFAFGFKGEDDRYEFYAAPPKSYAYRPERSREEQCLDWAMEYVRELESHLERYPNQWFNFYPFWSALPTAPNGEIAALTNNRLREESAPLPPQKLGSEPDSTTNGEL